MLSLEAMVDMQRSKELAAAVAAEIAFYDGSTFHRAIKPTYVKSLVEEMGGKDGEDVVPQFCAVIEWYIRHGSEHQNSYKILVTIMGSKRLMPTLYPAGMGALYLAWKARIGRTYDA